MSRSVLCCIVSCRSLELNKSDSSIVCVRCHPRITDCLVVAFQDGTLYVYNPLSSLKPVMELTVARNPLDVCFGSGVGSDQFCLYVLDRGKRRVERQVISCKPRRTPSGERV